MPTVIGHQMEEEEEEADDTVLVDPLEEDSSDILEVQMTS